MDRIGKPGDRLDSLARSRTHFFKIGKRLFLGKAREENFNIIEKKLPSLLGEVSRATGKRTKVAL